ncbi:MAG: DUF4391 domain-containing protein [Deltaproteobacteria bacterium]|nr:DUF4391 domain-containing protein [Deltaproteobacteria bacterium]
MADFYEKLAIPDSCYLGKRVFKKLFYENTRFNATDKKTFRNDVETIEWRYTLKPETINISRYEDDEREYFEVAVIQVTLKEPKRYRRIAQIIQRAIPYPLLIVFRHGAAIALSVAAKRINRADREKILTEELQETHWLNLENLLDYEKEFLEKFGITNYSYNNFYEFYNDLTDRITTLNCAVHTGCYSLTTEGTETCEKAGHYNTSETGNRLKRLQELERLQQEKAELRNRLKKEKNMGTQVELNTQVKKISDQIKSITSQL